LSKGHGGVPINLVHINSNYSIIGFKTKHYSVKNLILA